VAARAAPPALAEALAELLADARALRRRKADRRIKPPAHAIDAVLAHPRERLRALPRLDVVVVKRQRRDVVDDAEPARERCARARAVRCDAARDVGRRPDVVPAPFQQQDVHAPSRHFFCEIFFIFLFFCCFVFCFLFFWFFPRFFCVGLFAAFGPRLFWNPLGFVPFQRFRQTAFYRSKKRKPPQKKCACRSFGSRRSRGA
jgi:hypothetical protein